MDYSRWAEIPQQQQQQQQPQQQQHHSSHHAPAAANEQYSSQYYNAQPYNPYPYQPNPTNTVTVPQKHPPPVYNNPSTHHDLGHSDASLRPPGMDPYSTAAAAGHNSYAPNVGHEQMSASVPAGGYFQQPHPQDWVVKDAIRQYGADPVHYGPAGIPQNVMEQSQTSNPNMMGWNNPMYPGLLSRPWKKGPKKTKVVQSVHCEVCNLDCNSKDVYDMHRSGKKHQRNVEKLHGDAQNQRKVAGGKKGGVSEVSVPFSPMKRKMTVGSVAPENLETKRMKLMEGGAAAEAVKICDICNLVCNSQTVFDYHLAGKKHAAQLQKYAGVATGVDVGTPRVILNPMIGNSLVFHPASVNGTVKKASKKRKGSSNSAWCMTCKVDCNSKEMLEKHRSGKRHKKKLQKLKEPVQNQKKVSHKQKKKAISVGVGSCTAADSSSAQVEPKENPSEKGGVENGSGGNLQEQEDAKKAVMAPVAAVEDLDTKKRRLVECGAKEEDLKVCAVCNLVCNSQQGFILHLAGKKHAAQMKKQAELPGADAPLVFSEIPIADAPLVFSEIPIADAPLVISEIPSADAPRVISEIPSADATPVFSSA